MFDKWLQECIPRRDSPRWSTKVLETRSRSHSSRNPEVGLERFPRRSKYPIFEVSGSKSHTLNGIWDQRPSILGTWTLWVWASQNQLVKTLNSEEPDYVFGLERVSSHCKDFGQFLVSSFKGAFRAIWFCCACESQGPVDPLP